MRVERKRLLESIKLAFKAADKPRDSGQGLLFSPRCDVRYSGGVAPCLEATDGTVGIRIPLTSGLGAGDAPGMVRRAVIDVLKALPRAESVDVEGWTRPAVYEGPDEADGTPPRGSGVRQGVEIKEGAFCGRLFGAGNGEWADLPWASPAVATLEPGAFVAAARVAQKYCGRDSTRPLVESLTLEVSGAGGTANLIATDGGRLYEAAALGRGDRHGAWAFRREAADLACAAITYAGADCHRIEVCAVEDDPDALVLRCGPVEVFSLGEAAVVPVAWRDFLGNGSAVEVEADREEWLAALKRVGALSGIRVGVAFYADDDGAAFSYDDPDGGMVTVPVAGSTTTGGAFSCRVWLGKMRDAFRACEGKRVAWAFNGEDKATMIRDGGALHVVMPMRW